MRVLITCTSLAAAYGGPAFSVSRLGTALGEAGAEVGLWSADDSTSATPLLAAGAPVRRLDGDLDEALRRFGPDVVHDNGLWLPHNHQVARLAADAGIPRVVSTRGMLAPWARAHKRWKKTAAWRLYQRGDLQRADALHATAPPEADDLAALKLGPAITTIPNGTDLPSPRAVAANAAPSGDRTALFLGRIYPVKGLPMLIEAWAQVRPAGWRLVIAGPDEAGHQREVERAVAAAGLSDVVSFPGAVLGDEKARLFQSAALCVAPSLSESFGMAVAEALSYGLPVLTTTAAPWPELETKRCGWRTAPSADALAVALRQATALSPLTLAAMGAAGRELIAAEFGWDRIAARFLDLYEGLTASRHGESGALRLAAGAEGPV
jgi:glycosyltransferase involved in cell wall biosynthesis